MGFNDAVYCGVDFPSSTYIDGVVLTSKVVLIYVLGGISFMEISALRFLSKREECELNHPRYLSSF